jgi:D-glycero-D-manno-heptose 1,7-bisphosphate phosphatase
LGLNKAIFLDRDGVLIEENGYPGAVGQVRPIGSSIDAVKKFNNHNLLVIVVTNQSAVARGFISEKQVVSTNNRLAKYFKQKGAAINGFYYCPHHPEGSIEKYSAVCDCRKPLPGLLRLAASEHDIELKNSFMVGDKDSDISAGLAAGCNCVFIGKHHDLAPAFHDLYSASSYIIDVIDNEK